MTSKQSTSSNQEVKGSKKELTSLSHAQIPKIQTAEGWKRDRLRDKKLRT